MRFFAFTGRRRTTWYNQTFNRQPWVVIMGPSGNLVQLHPVSGYTGKSIAPASYKQFQQCEATQNQKPLGWMRGCLVTWWSQSYNTTATEVTYCWLRQHQLAPKVNPSYYDPPQQFYPIDTNTNANDYVIEDGHHWRKWQYHHGIRNSYAFLRTYDALLYQQAPYYADHCVKQGLFRGREPFRMTSPRAWWVHHGGRNDGDIAQYSHLWWPGGNVVPFQEGVYWGYPTIYPTDLSLGMCDIIEHKGSIYSCNQYAVYMQTNYQCRGTVLQHFYAHDNNPSYKPQGLYAGYISRYQTPTILPAIRCFAKHRGKLYMLDNYGVLCVIDEKGVTPVYDFTTLGTPFSSGIFGGYIKRTPGAGYWTTGSAYRPFMASFNDQLHVFLNYAGYDKDRLKGLGNGVCWFTSHDTQNWSDRTLKLPSSGIQPPIDTSLGAWLQEISPYRFSARQNTNWPSGYGIKSPGKNIWGEGVSGYQGPWMKPSGYRQTIMIPFWASGSFDDIPGTKYNALKTPLEYGTISGFLAPTYVSYPSGFGGINPSGVEYGYKPMHKGGIWGPIGQGGQGWVFTGCGNYHVAGYVDRDDGADQRLRMAFSQKSDDSNTQKYPDSRTIFFDLTMSSGWIQRNEAPYVQQLNGYLPFELQDPELILPSGHVAFDSNFKVDTVKQTVRIDFAVSDWLYWDKVNVRTHYSIDDGENWLSCTTSGQTTNLSTGTKQTDPSGQAWIPACNHTIWWLYGMDLSKNEYYPNVRIRMRAEVP